MLLLVELGDNPVESGGIVADGSVVVFMLVLGDALDDGTVLGLSLPVQGDSVADETLAALVLSGLDVVSVPLLGT